MQPSQQQQQQRSVGSLVGGIILGVSVAGIGLIFFVSMFRSWQRDEAIRKWPTTTATITHSALEQYRATPNSPLSYRPDIEYAYAFDGGGYTSDRVKRRQKTSSHRDRIEKIVDRYPVGKEATAWVDPSKPGFAVLEHETRAVLYSIWFPGLFIVAGFGIVLAAVKGYRRGATQP